VQGTLNDKDQKGSKVSSVEKQVNNFNLKLTKEL